MIYDMFIVSLMVAGIAAVLVSSYKIARSRVYAVGIVRKLPRSQDAVGEQATRLPGPTEVSAPNEPTASDLSTDETASHSGLSEDAASRRVALVQGSPLFMGLSPAECREIVSVAHEKQFARRQSIFLEGDPVRRVVLLTSGSAKIVQLGQSGTEVILGVRGPGDVIEEVGTVGLRPQGRHSSTAQALGPSTALVWDAAAFEMLYQRSAHLRRNTIGIIRQQLHELEERYREISTEKVSVRLSHQLIRLQNQLGRAHGGLEIRLSREELAQLTGATLFTVSRLLSEWNQQGIVSTSREAVRVHDLSNLEKRLVDSATGAEETVHDAPLPPQADSYRAFLAAADLAELIKDLKASSQSVSQN